MMKLRHKFFGGGRVSDGRDDFPAILSRLSTTRQQGSENLQVLTGRTNWLAVERRGDSPMHGYLGNCRSLGPAGQLSTLGAEFRTNHPERAFRTDAPASS